MIPYLPSMNKSILFFLCVIISLSAKSEINIDKTITSIKNLSLKDKIKKLEPLLYVNIFEYNKKLERCLIDIIQLGLYADAYKEVNIARLIQSENLQQAYEFKKSLEVLKGVGNYFGEHKDYLYQAIYYSQSILVYTSHGEVKRALADITKFKEIEAYVKDDRIGRRISLLEASIRMKNQEYLEAEAILNKALVEAKSRESNDYLAKIYALLGNVFQNQDNLGMASTYFSKSAEYALRSGNLIQLAEAQTNLGIVEYIQGNMLICQDLMEKALVNYRKLGRANMIIEGLYNLGVFHVDNGHIKEATMYFLKGFDHSIKYNYKKDQLDFCMELANMHEGQKLQTKANDFLRKYIDIQNELLKEEIKSQEEYGRDLSELKMKQMERHFQLKESSLKNELKSAQTKSSAYMFMAFGLVGFTILLVWYLIKLKRRSKEMKTSAN
jgi:tetratricopeptide (TPR) repeat protein